MRVAVLTISSSRKEHNDASGDALVEAIDAAGFDLSARELVSDDRSAIESKLKSLAGVADCVLTTGGTGITADDVTPEATLAVCDREVPGIAEALRASSTAETPMAMLSRAVAGTLGNTLIVNLPGSPKACRHCFAALEPVLEHASAQLNR
ncbi:MAG: MogA/MoaB family molybdenum cofactor biosynthesis protein [Solirubrobacterales bacterium]|nr:MogA/MoaB family molybdenum cofactor biosynthesis protein [Solirubrobacterales bacterium]